MKATHLICIALIGALLAGCATNDPNRDTKTGAIVGAIVGAVIGNQGNSRSERFLGAAAGAIGGAAVGNYMDRQRHDLEAKLADEQRKKALDITELGNDTLKIGIASDATFAFDSSSIQPQFQSTYNKIANTLAQYNKTVVHIVGYTDSTGTRDYNLGLSQRRAHSVGQYLSQHGVDGNRLIYYGMGEKNPVASNDTEAGRRRNRRVEIYIKPIVQGKEAVAYQPPPGVTG